VRETVRVIEVSRAFVLAVGEDAAQDYVSRMAAGDWAFRGPRGGRYLSPGDSVTTWQVDRQGFFERDADRYIARRPPSVYVRPSGSLLARWSAAEEEG
jgi:hypothetical protein